MRTPIFSVARWFFYITTVVCMLASCRQKAGQFNSWKVYRGDEGSNAYSQLNQINTGNVKQLKPAWIYHTGDSSQYNNLECNPIIVDSILFGISPRLKTFAVNAKTGKEIWIFNPFEENSNNSGVGRGLMYWKDGDEARIYMFAGNKLLALDAKTGRQIMNFGDSGNVDLTKGLRNDDSIEHVEDVGNTSPGVIYKDLIISGSGVSENYGSSPGHIRAYDVRTGKMKWIFHTIPHPGEPGYDTWPKDAYKNVGGCNAWSGLSLDSKRGIVFAATGAPAFDFHGGERFGQNLYGNSVLALDAATGKLVWHFQVSHHDLWDYDLPSPPNLVTIQRDGKAVDAVAQITKQGLIFILDRETGKPLFPVEEKPVAASTMPGEESWPTQPFPLKPLPLSRLTFDTSAITNISPEAHNYILDAVKNYTWGNIYLPPSIKGIVQLPGFRGGGEWSGGCVDKETGIMYIGINDIANIVQLVERKDETPAELASMPVAQAGQILFERNCAACHGNDLKGNRSFPPLVNIEKKLKPADLKSILQKPRGMMPSFNSLPEEDKNAISAFLFKLKNSGVYTAKTKSTNPEVLSHAQKRYSLKGYLQLKDQNGYFGTKPPWGTLNAVNLNTGDLQWKIPLGEYPELAARGLHNTGTQLFGGGIVTAGGLVFIAATQDEKFRAIDKTTGKILWEYQLPFGGYATPATYAADGKQYVVIAAGGGGRQLTKAGDCYVAFALP